MIQVKISEVGIKNEKPKQVEDKLINKMLFFKQ